MDDALPPLLLIVPLLGGALLLFALWHLFKRRRWRAALGRVVSHGAVEPPAPGASRPVYWMDVGIEFRADDGQTFRFSEKVRALDVIPAFNKGALIAVRYRPEDPHATADTHASGDLGGSIFLVIVGLLLVLPAAFYGAMRRGLAADRFAGGPLDNIALILCSSIGIAVFLLPALLLAFARLRFLATAVPAQMRVVALQKEELVLSHVQNESGSAETATQAAYVQFELTPLNQPSMRIAQSLPTGQTQPPPFTVGEVMQVLYAPGDPNRWIQDRWSSRWLGALLLAAAGLALLAGGWLLRPSAAEVAHDHAIQAAFDELRAAKGTAQEATASRDVFNLMEQEQVTQTAQDTFALEKLREVVALWDGIRSGESAPGRNQSRDYSLRATEPLPERWPPQSGDGIVYYVYPYRALPDAGDPAEPIAQVTVRAGHPPEVRPLAQSLAPLGVVPLRPPGAEDNALAQDEAVQVARAWIMRKHSFASLSPHARDALKPYYCRRLGSGEAVLPKMMRLHHADFLDWLSCSS